MTSEPAVAIVIPCYNPRSFLAEALESALGQTHRNLDVVVVNDGSRRGFWETVSPYRDAVRILEQPNAGVAAARNRAIEASDAPLIAFLDQDDRWRPEKIARQVHFLAEHHECALVHTGRRFIDANGEQIPKPGPVWAPAEGSCLDRLILHNTIQPSSVLLRRAALGSERFASEAVPQDDWDMWLQLAARWSVGYIDEPLIDCRLHGGNESRNQRRMLEGFLAVMERALARGLPPALAIQAERRARRMRLDVGHIDYESGADRAFRRACHRAFPDLERRDVVRYLATLLPSHVRQSISGWLRW